MLALAWARNTMGAAPIPGAAAALAIVELPELVVASGSASTGWIPGGLLMGWGLSMMVFMMIFMRAFARLRRDGRVWERARVLDRSVLVSRELGPAVAGVVRP